jgi:hypothetical protein
MTMKHDPKNKACPRTNWGKLCVCRIAGPERYGCDEPLRFDSYTLHVGMGDYEYRIVREPADQPGEVEPIMLGTTHAVTLYDEKNSWYVGQCDTYEQALTIIGIDLIRNAGQMAEMCQYDEPPTTDQLIVQQLCGLGYHTTVVNGRMDEVMWVNSARGTSQMSETSCTSSTHEDAWNEARLDAVRNGLIPALPTDSTDPIGY